MRTAGWCVAALGLACSGPTRPADTLDVPEKIEFGQLISPGVSTRVLTIHNPNAFGVALKGLEQLSGSSAFSFFLGPRHLGPYDSVSVTITLDATTKHVTEYEAELVLRSDVPDLHVKLTGTGVFVDCATPALIDFGEVIIGDTFRRSFTLLNSSGVTTTAELDIVHAATGPGAAFDIIGGGAVTLQPGESSDVKLTFKPTTQGDYQSSAMLRPHALCPVATPTVFGTGVAHVVTCPPEPVEIGWCPPGRTCRLEMTVMNQMLQPLPLTEVRVLTPPEFVLATDAGLTLPTAERVSSPPGAGYMPGLLRVPIDFTAAAAGPEHGSISVKTANPFEPTKFCVMQGFGGGPILEVSPSVVDFGTVTGPTTRTFTVKNAGTLQVSGTQQLPLVFKAPEATALTFDAQRARLEVGAFEDGGSLVAYTLLPGEQVDVPVTVWPLDAGGLLEWVVRTPSTDVHAADAGVLIRAAR